MGILKKLKDGGPNSPVDAYFLCEFKGWFSVALLKFNKGTREAFHSHAFNAYTWFLSGDMFEEDISGDIYTYKKSIVPKVTPKSKMHRVVALMDSWCFTVRGPWEDTWLEHDETGYKVLTHGRKEVEYGTTGLAIRVCFLNK